MRLFVKSGSIVDALAFEKDAADRVEGFSLIPLDDGMDVIDYGAILETGVPTALGNPATNAGFPLFAQLQTTTSSTIVIFWKMQPPASLRSEY